MSSPQSLSSKLLTIDASGFCVIAAISAAVYVVGVRPQLDADARLQERRQFLDEQSRNAANTEGLIVIEQKKLSDLKARLRDTSVPLFPPSDIHKRLQVITQLSRGNDLTIAQLEPGVAKPDPESGKFAVVPIRLAGSGSYAGVSGFLTELLGVAYPDVEVRTLTLNAAADAQGDASFIIELRWYADLAARASDAAGAGGVGSAASADRDLSR